MFFWNKVEIYCGFSFKEFTELRNSLAVAGIRYDYKLESSNDNRGRHGSLGMNPEYTTMYYLYVHKKDYDHAIHHTSNRHI